MQPRVHPSPSQTPSQGRPTVLQTQTSHLDRSVPRAATPSRGPWVLLQHRAPARLPGPPQICPSFPVGNLLLLQRPRAWQGLAVVPVTVARACSAGETVARVPVFQRGPGTPPARGAAGLSRTICSQGQSPRPRPGNFEITICWTDSVAKACSQGGQARRWSREGGAQPQGPRACPCHCPPDLSAAPDIVAALLGVSMASDYREGPRAQGGLPPLRCCYPGRRAYDKAPHNPSPPRTLECDLILKIGSQAKVALDSLGPNPVTVVLLRRETWTQTRGELQATRRLAQGGGLR